MTNEKVAKGPIIGLAGPCSKIGDYRHTQRWRCNLKVRRNGKVQKFFKKSKLTFAFSCDKATVTPMHRQCKE